MIEKLKERGIIAVRYNEWGTSSERHKCGGRLKGKGRRVICTGCGLRYDLEFDTCIRLLQKAGTYLKGKTSEA
ncbi:MAG: zinc ribbon domain-containing protein [Candidatus Methanomethylicaceae archaeon]